MKIMFLVLALVLVTVSGGLLLQDDEVNEVDDALLAVDDTDEVEEVDDALLVVDDTDEVDDALSPVDDTDEVDDALPPFDALDRGDFKQEYITGDLVKLGKYYPKGIPFSVLFTFDTKFISMFGNKGMDTLIELVKKHYQDKSLKNGIGTTINVTGTKRKYTRTFKDTGGRKNKGDFPDTLEKDATKISTTLKKNFDAYIYVMAVATNGGGGISYGATVCNAKASQRISMVMGPMESDCKSDFKKACTNSIRLSVLGKTAAHELGHTLGMEHDFDTQTYIRSGHKKFVYRKYKGTSCKGGLMSYAEPRGGWSACGQRDFSRYLTSGGKKKPCTFGGSIKSTAVKGGCTADCASVFTRCVKGEKNREGSCSGAYKKCRYLITLGRIGGCTSKCKDTKSMTALKSTC